MTALQTLQVQNKCDNCYIWLFAEINERKAMMRTYEVKSSLLRRMG